MSGQRRGEEHGRREEDRRRKETEKDGAGVTLTILLKIVGELLAIHWSEDEEEVSSVFWLPSLIVPITSSRNIGSVVVPLPRP